MPLRFSADPPTGVAEQLSGWLPSTRGGAQHQLSVGVRWVTVPLNELAQGRFLEATTGGRWRFLVLQDGAPFAHVDLDDSHRVVGLNQGHAVQGFIDALERAQAVDGDYEALVVEVPALRFTALWLRGERDLLLPFPSPLSPVSGTGPQTADQTLSTLQADARAALSAMGRGGPIGN